MTMINPNESNEGPIASISSASYPERNFQEQPTRSFGNAYHGNRNPVTIEKFLKKSEANTVLCDRIEMPREVVILRKISPHANIITLHYWMKVRPEEWMIVLEYYESNLKDYLNNVARSRGTDGLTEEESKRIMHQLLLACKHLEDYGIYHRNLKLENIVIGIDGNIKLVNFDLAIEAKKNEQYIVKIGSSK